MTRPNEPQQFDERIKSMFGSTWDSYQAYLENSEPTPYPIESLRGMELTDGGSGLFLTTMSFLAQKNGIGNRINFKIPDNPSRAQCWGRVAVVSYSSLAEKTKDDAFLDAHWNPNNGSARELLLDISQANQLLSISALRAGVSLREVLEVFPHIGDDEYKRSEETYGYMKEAFRTNPDRLCGVIVLQNLRKYYNERFASGLLLHKAQIKLLEATQALDPTKDSTEEIDKRTTDNMSCLNQGLMEKQTLEALIRDGYEPIEPAVYVEWVDQIMSRD